MNESIDWQRNTWSRNLINYDWTNPRPYGYEWGDPDLSYDPLGDYRFIRDYLKDYTKKDRTILEIGSLGGKWIQFILRAGKVICVDITDTSFKYIKHRFPCDNVEFYLTSGNELMGIVDNSVDLVYSIDSLVRSDVDVLESYVDEAARVLKPGGRTFLHFPCSDCWESKWRGFTEVDLNQLQLMFTSHVWREVIVHGDIVVHGVIMEAIKR